MYLQKTCSSGRSNMTTVNFSECSRRLIASLVFTVSQKASSAGGAAQDAEANVRRLARKKPNAKPTSKHTVFCHFPKDPKCDVCKMTQAVRARRQQRPERRTDGVALPTQLGEVITDHKVLSEDTASGMQLGCDVVQGFLDTRAPMT